jgi:DNA mismatch repair protein MutS
VRPGPASKSYGLQVAQKAGVPREVIESARAYLGQLERQHAPPIADIARALVRPAAPAPGSAALEKLRKIEPDGLTPKEALQALYELRSLLQPSN